MFSNGNSVNKRWEGRHAILLVRASTGKQKVSVEQQEENMRAFCAREGIIVIAVIGKAGQSGSKTWDRQDIEEILTRKRSNNDFDLVVAYDSERFTRGGNNHFKSVETQFIEADLDLIYSTEERADGLVGEITDSVRAAAAEMRVELLSKAVCRSRQHRLEQGYTLPYPRPPYGTDEMIVKSDGSFRHLLHYHTDGRLLVLHPETRELIRDFPPAREFPTRSHMVKEPGDTERLWPGAPEEHEVVIRIFTDKFIRGIGPKRIAQQLDKEGIPGPGGKGWTERAVRKILNRPAYIGLIIGNMTSNAIFHRHAHGEPMPVHRSKRARIGKERPPMVYRPREQWNEREEPAMRDYLPEPVRSAAVKSINEYLDRIADGRVAKRKEQMPRNWRDYPLTGILVGRHHGKPLRGKRNGSKRKRWLFGVFRGLG